MDEWKQLGDVVENVVDDLIKKGKGNKTGKVLPFPTVRRVREKVEREPIENEGHYETLFV